MGLEYARISSDPFSFESASVIRHWGALSAAHDYQANPCQVASCGLHHGGSVSQHALSQNAVCNKGRSNGCASGLISPIAAQEKPEGKLGELWMSSLQAAELKHADVSAAFSELLASKDAADQMKAKKAAYLASSAMKNFAVPELESARLFPLCCLALSVLFMR
jgi:hypothetical protein